MVLFITANLFTMTTLVQRRAPEWEAKAVVEGRIEDRDSKAYEGKRSNQS